MIETATGQWESVLGQDLFYLDHNADVAVSFVFDDRQAVTDAQAADLARLDAIESQNEVVKTTIDELQATYDNMRSSFEERKAAYDADLQQYEQDIRQVNDRGGAPAEEFAVLNTRQTALEDEFVALRQLSADLSSIATELNTLTVEGNKLLDAYNDDVNEFNDQYGDGGIFTQGDYTGDAINIYQFSNENELLAVLVHEFGHALGIEHVGQSGALMHYLLEEGGETAPTLHPVDIAAARSVCQFDSWDFRVRQLIRSVF